MLGLSALVRKMKERCTFVLLNSDSSLPCQMEGCEPQALESVLKRLMPRSIGRSIRRALAGVQAGTCNT